MAKHTPGPWTAEPNGTAEEGFNIVSPRNAYIAFVASVDDNHSVEEAHANARLIAEAPAMAANLTCVLLLTENDWANLSPNVLNETRIALQHDAHALLARIDEAEAEPLPEDGPIVPTSTNAKRNARKKPGRR